MFPDISLNPFHRIRKFIEGFDVPVSIMKHFGFGNTARNPETMKNIAEFATCVREYVVGNCEGNNII